jgi:thiol:disulfide interchange protein
VIELADATEKLDSGDLIFTTRSADGGFVDIKAVLGAAPAKPAPTPNTPAKAAGDWQPWSPEEQAKALAAGKIVYVDFTARWCATCQVNKRVYTQDDVAKALNQAGVVMLKADWTKKDSIIANELGKYGRTGIPLNVFLKTGQPPAILSEALTGTEVLSALSAVSAGKPYQAETTTHSFAIWMLLAFGGGILLNLMPCVFPMIGLKVLGFAKEAGAARGKVILNGLLYSAGVIASFLALALLIIGLKSGGSSVGWGFQMQSPGFVLGTCVLMIVLGLSLAGVFEIGVGLGGVSAGEGDGRVATFLSGVLATVVATPCTAPGLGAALGFALDKERSTGRDVALLHRDRPRHGATLPAPVDVPPPCRDAPAPRRVDGVPQARHVLPAFRLRALPALGTQRTRRRCRLGARCLTGARLHRHGLLGARPLGRPAPLGQGTPDGQAGLGLRCLAARSPTSTRRCP